MDNKKFNNEKFIEDRKEEWMKKNAKLSQFLFTRIMGMSPEVGFYVNVEGIKISQDFFKEEYEVITTAYNSVMMKLDEYYKLNKNK